ncbi:hypothetical protein R3I94_023264 [Phoxinus phoxinus]
MVSEKKPAGTVSPPTRSPTPAAPPSSVQHNTMARHQGVDTSMLRRAIWNYIQWKFGIRCLRDAGPDEDGYAVSPLLTVCIHAFNVPDQAIRTSWSENSLSGV